MEKGVIRIIPLGGLGEIGKNMMVIEFNDTIVIVDSGIMFPGERMNGIDFIIPDFSYLTERKDKIRGILLTHGHEDHIGALPYLLKEISAPVYGTRLTLGFCKNRLEDHNLPTEPEFREIEPRQRVDFGEITAEFFSVFHSIADGIGIAFHTPYGTIVHSGDFKIDYTHIDASQFDFYKLAEYGENGVLLLLSDSTNSEHSGYTPSEIALNESLREAISESEGKVLVATFASSTHRIQQVFDAALHTGRKIAILGRRMETNISMAKALGYLRFDESIMIPPDRIKSVRSSEVIVLTTGSQGEPMSALSKIALGKHGMLDIEKGDKVIISASVIPGNEKTVSRIVDCLYRRGARVIYEGSRQIHVSGHASQEELKLLMAITKPRYFIPIHGEFRQLISHASLARQVGMKEERILVVEDGDVVRIDEEGIGIETRLDLRNVCIDGKDIGRIETPTLNDRNRLSESGVVVVVIPITVEDGGIMEPEIFSKGFVFSEDPDTLLGRAKDIVMREVRTCVREKRAVGDRGTGRLKKVISDSLRDYFLKETAKRPVIVPIVIEV
ncbi:MAG: ribonuclease J [Spirochaetes bacterium]|nr:ribonuclease J [Spirochaetota bacterium]